MDDSVHVLDKEDFPSVNLLCKDKSLEDALNISLHNYEEDRLTLRARPSNQGMIIDNLGGIFYQQKEYEVLTDFFFKHIRDVNLYFSSPIYLPNNPSDVRFRQQGVREIAENKDIAKHIYGLISNPAMFEFESHPYWMEDVKVKSFFTPEKLRWFIEEVVQLEIYNPTSGPLNAAIDWAKRLKEDTITRELFINKRHVADSRIFLLFSERFQGSRYGLLKPGVKPEDVFDFLSKDLSSYETIKTLRNGKKKAETRELIKYHKALDEELALLAASQGRQRMDILNKVTSELFILQTVLAQIQLQHLYQGAVLYNKLKKARLPRTFPEIKDDPGIINMQNAMPTRLVLNNFIIRYSEKLCPNDFSFSPEDRIVQIEGPNNSGKSEAWRTMHLTNLLVNSGYPVVADYCEWGIKPQSHFISCKGDAGIGGSELEKSKQGIFEALKYIDKNDQVILDELGDSTNAHTAQEMGKRLLTELEKKCSKVFITSHHGALTELILKEFSGVTLMPDPAADGVRKYRLVPSTGIIDYKSGEVLDEMSFTSKKIADQLELKQRRKIAEKKQSNNDPLPF